MNKLGRIYFPEIHSSTLDEKNKRTIIDSIEKDFEYAKKGIKKLPGKSKLAVSLAYHYYRSLLNKLKKVPASEILSRRIRVPDLQKIAILLKVYFLNIFFILFRKRYSIIHKIITFALQKKRVGQRNS